MLKKLQKIKGNLFYTFANFYALILPVVAGLYYKIKVDDAFLGALVFSSSLIVYLDLPGKILRSSVERLIPKYLKSGGEEKAEAYSGDVFYLSQAINLIFTLVLVVLSFLFPDQNQQWAFLITAAIFLADGISSFFAPYFKGYSRVSESAWVVLIRQTLFHIPLLFFVFFLGDKGYVIGNFLGIAFTILVIAIYSFRFQPIRNSLKKVRFRIEEVKQVFSIGLAVTIFGTLTAYIYSMDTLFMKQLTDDVSSGVSDATIAYYGFATQVFAVAMIMKSFTASFAPKIYTFWEEKKDIQPLIDKISAINMLLSVAATAAIFFLVEPLIAFVFSSKPAWLAVVPFFKILCVVLIPMVQFNIGFVVLLARTDLKKVNVFLLILLPLKILFLYLFYHFFGMEGIAWSTVLIVVLMCAMVGFVNREWMVHWYSGIILTAVAVLAVVLSPLFFIFLPLTLFILYFKSYKILLKA